MTGMLFLKSPRRIKPLMFTQMEENIKTVMMTVENKGAIFVVSKKNIYSLCCVCYRLSNSKRKVLLFRTNDSYSISFLDNKF